MNKTVTVDIDHIPSGTQVALYFDLLGFGEADSQIFINNVKEIVDQPVSAPLSC